MDKRNVCIRVEGLSAAKVAAEAAPNTSRRSVARSFDLGSCDCGDRSPRLRKSFVPRRRPFKMAESRLATVPVRRWLMPRAASTLLASASRLRKARPEAPVHSKRKGSGTMAHGDPDGFQFPDVEVPLVARVPGVPQFGDGLQRPGRARLLCHRNLLVRQPSIFSAAQLLRPS
jgi:hypothetical protein